MFALSSAVVAAVAPSARAQDSTKSVASIEQRVDKFIELLEARRKEQGVIGAAVVVAQGDRIVRSAGLGQRSLDSSEPVTDETVFAMGSVTKQFTAMAVALTVSDGKMGFEDHPRRYVPTFRLQDAEADAQLNMIDLLAHRSGLDRSDWTWILAPFTQSELFELAYRAKPAAKLRERFLYNNTMYALAGAALARAQQTTYERFVSERLLAPLGMRSSTLTLAGLTSSANHAVGYGRIPGGPPKRSKLVDMTSVASAGALNSTARDMGAWLRFLNSGGRIDAGSRIAPAAYARVFESHQQLGASAYGLGFFLHTRSGVRIAEHGGNVFGYTAQVTHVPERGLSFALLTNQDFSSLADIAHELFWETVVKPELPAAASPPSGAEAKPAGDSPTPPQPIAPERLIGHYFSSKGGGAFDVAKADSGLAAMISGQPPYPLAPTATNTFDLSGLSGYSLAFAESNAMPGRIVALFRQPPSHPAGNINLLKKDEPWLARAKEQHEGAGKELIGSYRSDDQDWIMEIVPYQGRVALVLTGQPPLPLKSLGADIYQLEGFPESFQVRIKRSGSGVVVGFSYIQPNVRLEMNAATAAETGAAERARGILERAVAATGGAEALDRLTSMRASGRASAPTHGLEGRAEDRVALGSRAELIELGAFGKTVMKLRSVTSERRSLVENYDGEQMQASGRHLRRRASSLCRIRSSAGRSVSRPSRRPANCR